MTRRPYLDERDPAEPATWEPTSHEWARKAALAAAEAAVRASKDRRKTTRNARPEESQA